MFIVLEIYKVRTPLAVPCGWGRGVSNVLRPADYAPRIALLKECIILLWLAIYKHSTPSE